MGIWEVKRMPWQLRIQCFHTFLQCNHFKSMLASEHNWRLQNPLVFNSWPTFCRQSDASQGGSVSCQMPYCMGSEPESSGRCPQFKFVWYIIIIIIIIMIIVIIIIIITTIIIIMLHANSPHVRRCPCFSLKVGRKVLLETLTTNQHFSTIGTTIYSSIAGNNRNNKVR